MKKIIATTLLAGLVMSSGAFAGTPVAATPVVLAANAMVTVGDVNTDINIARQYLMTAIAAPVRSGFVKNNFESTLSANVIAGAFDNAQNSRFGVIAGSNKGYNVFTGSSVGGSVAQCGAQVVKDTPNLGASLVLANNLILGNANGCGRQP
ncbi:hypothetical protein [Pseudomonas peli]|uniref:hypothetical protein n=1 Tax=Pseudomonas peli TaxID=592361 RepID=UPI00285572D3|nr:hypothetical protein [Pseudomonas peli]MDR7023435.1 hypothetical protein [Pseudomonas peli]